MWEYYVNVIKKSLGLDVQPELYILIPLIRFWYYLLPIAHRWRQMTVDSPRINIDEATLVVSRPDLAFFFAE